MNTPCELNRRRFIRSTAILGLATLASPALRAAEHASDAWQIGCYTRPWDAFELPVALDGIAEAGFKYAGIMTARGKAGAIITATTSPDEASRIGEEVKKRGLATLSVYGDFSVAASEEQGIKGLKSLIDNCRACGSPNLLLGGIADEALYQRYYKAIAENCAYAATAGVTLTIKPHGGKNATGPQCRQAIERVNHRNFRLWYDPGNIFYYSKGALDPVNDSTTVDGLVVGMSVKDFIPPQEVLLTPGDGKVNFVKVLSNLRKGGFTRGPLVVECLKKGDLSDLSIEAKKTRRFVETLLRA